MRRAGRRGARGTRRRSRRARRQGRRGPRPERTDARRGAPSDRRSTLVAAVVTDGPFAREGARFVASATMNAALHTGRMRSRAWPRRARMVVDVVPGLGDLRPPRGRRREPRRPADRAARGCARRCAPRSAVALWLEGVAGTPAEALKLVEDGQIPLATNHDTGGVGPMAGVVNPSMPVWVARDEATGKVAWCPLNEGSGAVLRYGADGPEVLERLKWMARRARARAARGAAAHRPARPARPARRSRSRSATRRTTAPRRAPR